MVDKHNIHHQLVHARFGSTVCVGCVFITVKGEDSSEDVPEDHRWSTLDNGRRRRRLNILTSVDDQALSTQLCTDGVGFARL